MYTGVMMNADPWAGQMVIDSLPIMEYSAYKRYLELTTK